MNCIKISCLVLSFVFVFAGVALALDSVDIGLPATEVGHSMAGWGPIEPATSQGYYGGITDCRAIWTNSDSPATPVIQEAFIDLLFNGGPEQLSFRHLSGPADDSFEVYIGGVNVYTYNDPNDPGESWYVQGFNYTPAGPGMITVRFLATGTQWPSWATYGQVCFDGIWVGTGPVAAETDSWGGVKALFR